MNSQHKFVLALMAALYVVTPSATHATDDRTSSAQPQASSNTAEAGTAVTSAAQSQSAQKALHPGKSASSDAPDPASAQKTSNPKPAKVSPVSPGSSTFTQSALNSVGAMVRKDELPMSERANTSGNAVAARMDRDLAKASPVKPGTIDEQVHEDGRREERVHTLNGAEYCMTFESPSDPKDGIDKMQYGLHPGGMSNSASMHTCGHRFD